MSRHIYAQRAAYRRRAIACELERYLQRGLLMQSLLEDFEEACVECAFYGIEVGRG